MNPELQARHLLVHSFVKIIGPGEKSMVDCFLRAEKKRRKVGLGRLFFPVSVLICVSFCAVARAQYRFDQWTADNGLPQNSVYAIKQTRDGYLWMATLDGLVRFDGVRFTVFNRSNSPGIVNNRFITLFEDARGDLWAGTEESGIVRFHNGRFSSYGEADGVPRMVYWITSDDNGSVFIVSESQFIRFSGGQFSPFDPAVNPLPAARIRQQSEGVPCRLVANDKTYECYADGRRLKYLSPDGSPTAHSAVLDTDGTFWLVTADGKLHRYENGKVVRTFTKQEGLPGYPSFFLPGSRLSLLSKDSQDALWLTDLRTMHNELVLKKSANTPFELLNPFNLNTPIRSSYQDDEGNLWFSTLRDGLFRARKQVITAYSKTDGLLDNNVYPIYETQDGTIWIGTTRGLFSYKNGDFTLARSTENFNVNAIGEDDAGRVLVSDYGSLYVLEGSRFVPFHREIIPAPSSVFAIQADRHGAVWVGGEMGLMRFKDGVLKTFTTADGLAGNDVKTIIEDRAGGLWIGSYGGLSHFQDGRFTSWTESHGLPGRTVRSLYLDADETLWIGSYDSGLARFKDGRFTHYTTKIGLYNDGAFQILEDGRRNFWISSNRGIYRVNKDELNEFADGKRSSIMSVAYGKSDGMLNAECNGGRSPAGTKARDGRLWFPTQDGVAVINPETLQRNPQPPPVVIESVKIDNVFSAPPAVAEDSDITIEPHQQNFEIEYTALSFINSENLRFKYRLEGLDDEWVDAGTRRAAYFSYVPAGSYTFKVIAANSDGVWNETGASLRITVLPPFYRTWWFITLAILIIVAAVLLLYWRRISELKRKHAAQAAFSRRLIDSQEQERKRFAAELHDGLGQSLVIVKNLARLSLKQPGNQTVMLEHLEKISTTASQAIEETREIAFNLRPHLLDRLGLTRTIESMLDKVFNAGGINYETRLGAIDDVFADESEIMFYRIVQECASNIVKHAQATQAKVIIERGDGQMRLMVSDNGRGFDLSAIGNDLEKRSFGLSGISERTRLLGGRLNIKSEVGKGTTVEIHFNKK